MEICTKILGTKFKFLGKNYLQPWTIDYIRLPFLGVKWPLPFSNGRGG